jgi:hypothetical protein
VRRTAGVLWRDGAFGVVLLAPAAPEPLTLAGTGRALWAALDHPVTTSELAAELAAAFAVDRDRVEADIAPTLAELARIGAIEEAP